MRLPITDVAILAIRGRDMTSSNNDLQPGDLSNIFWFYLENYPIFLKSMVKMPGWFSRF